MHSSDAIQPPAHSQLRTARIAPSCLPRPSRMQQTKSCTWPNWMRSMHGRPGGASPRAPLLLHGSAPLTAAPLLWPPFTGAAHTAQHVLHSGFGATLTLSCAARSARRARPAPAARPPSSPVPGQQPSSAHVRARPLPQRARPAPACPAPPGPCQDTRHVFNCQVCMLAYHSQCDTRASCHAQGGHCSMRTLARNAYNPGTPVSSSA